jgi:hypothetical protein
MESSSVDQNKSNLCLTQGITVVFGVTMYTGFTSLYATLVCVACSQLEKLGAALLDNRLTRVTFDQGRRNDSDDPGSELQTHHSEQLIRRMREQLDECIRHHQETKRCDYNY